MGMRANSPSHPPGLRGLPLGVIRQRRPRGGQPRSLEPRDYPPRALLLHGTQQLPLSIDDLRIEVQSPNLRDADGDGVPDQLTESAARNGLPPPDWWPGVVAHREIQRPPAEGATLGDLRFVVEDACSQFENFLVGGAGFPSPALPPGAEDRPAKLVEGRAAAAPFWARLERISQRHVKELLRDWVRIGSYYTGVSGDCGYSNTTYDYYNDPGTYRHLKLKSVIERLGTAKTGWKRLRCACSLRESSPRR